jgi:hypothetical protein
VPATALLKAKMQALAYWRIDSRASLLISDNIANFAMILAKPHASH